MSQRPETTDQSDNTDPRVQLVLDDVYPLTEIAKGEHSQAFSFETPEGVMILRTSNETDYGFKKDAYAAGHFASGSLPIPVITDLGIKDGNTFYAISEAAPGTTIDKMGRDDIEKLAPRLFDVLDTLASTTVEGDGYGWWEPDGTGQYSSWRDTLEHLKGLPHDPNVTAASFFNPQLHQRITEVVTALFPFCPEDRQLVHGDIYTNLMSDGEQITALIDWSHSMYGDPLYDLAVLGFEVDNVLLAEYRKHLEETRGVPPDYEQRVLCYQLLWATSKLCYFAGKLHNQDRYEQTSLQVDATLEQAERDGTITG